MFKRLSDADKNRFRKKPTTSKKKPIALAGCKAGFHDQSDFDLYFKRLVGTTPGNHKTCIGTKARSA